MSRNLHNLRRLLSNPGISELDHRVSSLARHLDGIHRVCLDLPGSRNLTRGLGPTRLGIPSSSLAVLQKNGKTGEHQMPIPHPFSLPLVFGEMFLPPALWIWYGLHKCYPCWIYAICKIIAHCVVVNIDCIIHFTLA